MLGEFVRQVYVNSKNTKTRNKLFSLKGCDHLMRQLLLNYVGFIELRIDFFCIIVYIPYKSLSSLKAPSDFYLETEKPIFVINPVLTNGFGDLGIALELINKYSKKIRGRFHLIVFSMDGHLEKIRSRFNHTFKNMQNTTVELCACENLSKDNSEIVRIVEEKMKQSPCIAIAASSGIHFPKLMKLNIDAFHEIGGGSFSGSEPLVHTEAKLQIPLGFDEYSAGVLLPDSVDSSLEEILFSSGLIQQIAGNVYEGKENFSEFLLKNHVTLMYVESSFDRSIYFDFLHQIGFVQKKHISVIIPTEDPVQLNLGREEISPYLSTYYCPSIESTHFDALTQKSTVPPAIKGNTSFLNAIVGNTPFFYDARSYTLPVLKQLVACSKQYQEEIGDSAIEYLKQILSLAYYELDRSHYPLPQEVRDLATYFASNEESIRDGFLKLHQILRERYNAEHMVCNLLRQRLESLETQGSQG